MIKLPWRLTALFACLFTGLAAHAVPITYDFAGTGSVCTFASNAGCASTYEGAITGSVIIDVLANGPGAVSETKAWILRSAWSDLDEADFTALVESHSAKRQSGEAAEGLASFAEKRAGKWKG